MASFIVNIEIMPHKELLDPQGKAVTSGLKNIGFTQINNVRVGKFITFEINASDKDEAYKSAEKACKELLANPIMESFHIVVIPA
ncbi:MAG: phosphoribosylformylglycinamidine synthase subunit PurS [Bacteroidia bacterium]|nr:phosphoribosylformylglycinamidine synthase subunit PurS [Bacteroidia bacterium]